MSRKLVAVVTEDSVSKGVLTVVCSVGLVTRLNQVEYISIAALQPLNRGLSMNDTVESKITYTICVCRVLVVNVTMQVIASVEKYENTTFANMKMLG